ncbi:acyl-CoA dehydrogenase [Shewanella sp. C32]|uniref:Acyl-CoA dehydrogenase n=1 Tax=Shewanella electrica TaxID=515560 RepID=A0ABT2FKY8_9GAMM|nr:acyl-CoA dehydrogenase [Shewanella electrica]MCH1923769.1 acyl-CoA dehydrogenase [Shewanella electrica]MCS4556987.1 acyl-CoA dehydrogenase [Shewanella electrica]
MSSYHAPTDEMMFLLQQVFDAPSVWQTLPALADNIDIDTAAAILEEAAKINGELVAPLNRTGDEQGVRFTGGQVFTPDGYRDAYRQYAEGGWVGLCGEPEFGGMGMPKMLGVLVDELGYSANNAFNLYGSLTAGAALCIHAHGDDELKQRFLPGLYSGEWAGAMDMTEPQAGSDLRYISTKAEPQADGSYSISGSKIFITGGDHDLTANIIHLVLAKIAGSDGISLFVVPKIKVDAAGNCTEANGVSAGAIEHKMGLKASATCVMNYDNAEGFLVGRANRGLVCMFTMMNYERLSIGIQGLGSAQAAYRMAADYAKERLQGSDSSNAQQQAPIIVHGDVRRMLLNCRCLTDAGRALAVFTGLQLDLAKYSQDEAQKAYATKLAALLTPVTKAFLTDRGLECAISAQQVFGGHGYIRETGIEQWVRDTRIAQIYEGTNGIQAIDFLGRKLVADRLVTITELFNQLSLQLAQSSDVPSHLIAQQQTMQDDFLAAMHEVMAAKDDDSNLINAVAVDALDAFGYLMCGYFWLLMQQTAKQQQSTLPEAWVTGKSQLAEYYFARLAPRFAMHLVSVRAGSTATMQVDIAAF